MSYFVGGETLEFLWEAINIEPVNAKISKANIIYEQILKDGWAFNYQMEDILYVLDPRLVSHKFDLTEFSKVIGLKWENVYQRPKSHSSDAVGNDAIRVEEVALFLITLEQIGFNCDASYLVERLLPTLKSRVKKYLSEAELTIFWFGKVRHKAAPLRFLIEGSKETWMYNTVAERITTDAGYEIALEINENEELAGLRISAPKYKRARKIVRTVCPDCGLEWSKGDSDSSYYHRKEHKNRIVFMDPKPNEYFLAARQQEMEPELVTIHSPAWKHTEMYIRALAFKREFHYDFVQWKSPTGINDPNARGFLISNDEGAIIGAYSFRKISKGTQEDKWTLDWIWICPKHRRAGHLAKRWEGLRKRFGDFYIEPPVSNAMKSFLKKQGDLGLLEA